jgi:hypothetical protein
MPADIIELKQRRLNKQKPAQLARELMSFPAKRRLELILESGDARSMVAALDANDFFFTVQEIGPDDCLPLLAMGGVEQINHLFDLEWWRKDSLAPAKALTWIERLLKAGGLLQWISNADFELLVSLFKQWVTVDIAPDDVDLVEAVETLPPKTLDDLYFWESKYPQYDDLITHLLTVIFESNYGFFRELMNSVLYASAPEVEESAYHFHRARLQDHAVPDFYEALEIYRSIAPDEFAAKPGSPNGEEDRRVPSFALALLPAGGLFAQVLGRIEDPGLLEMLQFETAALCNKVTVADRLPPDNPEALRRAVEKALAYVSLGLELRSEGHIPKAEGIVRDNFLEHLFRLAQVEVGRIRGRLQALVHSGWLSRCPAGLKCLDGEWFDKAEELLAATPRILKSAAGSGPGAPPSYQFFSTRRDLAQAGHIVDVIAAAGDLFALLSPHAGKCGQRLWADGLVRAPEDVTLGVGVLTAAANFLISGGWMAEPLSRIAWPETFALLQPSAVEGAVMDWIGHSMPGRERRSLAEAYFTPVLREYELEMRPFSANNPPKAHLVKFFMFS